MRTIPLPPVDEGNNVHGEDSHGQSAQWRDTSHHEVKVSNGLAPTKPEYKEYKAQLGVSDFYPAEHHALY